MTTERLPNLAPEVLDTPSLGSLGMAGADHPPRILILYGSLRPKSYSRKLALEAERLLRQHGDETRMFDPHELPLLDSVSADHPEVQELRALSLRWRARSGSARSGTAP